MKILLLLAMLTTAQAGPISWLMGLFDWDAKECKEFIDKTPTTAKRKIVFQMNVIDKDGNLLENQATINTLADKNEAGDTEAQITKEYKIKAIESIGRKK